MILKKLGIALLVAILIIVTATGCGKSSDNITTSQTQPTTSITTMTSTPISSGTTSSGASFDSTTTTTTLTSTPSTTQISLDMGEKIPEGYPGEVLPIYPGSYILSAIGEGSSYTISAYSKDEIAKLIVFYQKALEKATVTSETVSDTSYTSWGNISGYTYIFDVGEDSNYKDYKSSIMISIYK